MCTHPRAHGENRCKSCGAITKSHPLSEVVHVTAPCPDCGKDVICIQQSFQCHRCWMKDPKAPEEL